MTITKKVGFSIDPSRGASRDDPSPSRDGSRAPINSDRLQSTQTITSGTIKKAVQQDGSRAPINSDTAGQSPVRITRQTHISTQSPITSTTIAAPSNISSISSSGFPQVRSGEKETVPKSTLDSVEVDDSTLPVRKESAAIMVAASTCITPNKEMNMRPVLIEPMPVLKAIKNKEEQTIMVSETNNKSNLLALKTSPTVFLEEMKPISSNLIPINSRQDGQLTLQGDRIKTTENFKPMIDYYFKPFLGGMGMWQPWMDMYNEFAIMWIRLSLNWFDLLWNLFGSSTVAD